MKLGHLDIASPRYLLAALQALERMVSKGNAPVNELDGNGRTAFDRAAVSGHAETAMALFKVRFPW